MPDATDPFPYPACELPTITQAGKRRVTKRFSRFMLLVLLAVPVTLMFAPWQQNLAGRGRVIDLDPTNRPMTVQARTDGIVLKWHVREGDYVTADQPLVDLADNDAKIIERLQEQLTAAEAKRDAAMEKRDRFAEQIKNAEAARLAAMQLADDEIEAAVQKLEVANQAVAVANQKLELANYIETMWEGMVRDRIGAGIRLREAKQGRAIAEAEVAAKAAGVTGAEAELRAKRSARKRVEQAELVKVQDARAKFATAEGEIATANGSIPKLERDLERQRQQQITAPLDGYVQNVIANGQRGAFVKKGVQLARIVPQSKQLAVELFVDGNDVTFIDPGRHVRLQFEGWPAIQWVGWPSAAVGTFGGKVLFVDRAANADGRFRVMVVPDERPFVQPEGPVVDWLRGLLTFDNRRGRRDLDENGEPNPHAWPGDLFLRQGVATKGWIVLDRVSLGFEIWRQLNGFPPTVDRPETTGKARPK